MDMYGWTGNIAVIDLDRGTIRRTSLPGDLARDFLGGRGLGAAILCSMVDSNPNPATDNSSAPLILAVGPLTGIAPMSGRHAFVTKSPLTGTIVDSSGGGFFGNELKRAGLDALIITGESDTPVHIRIDDDDISISDASSLWGRNVHETTDLLTGKYGGRVACIGRAGEKCVRFANIMNDHIHASGRGGIGAVMGQKKLKAIILNGTCKPGVANKKRFMEVKDEIMRLLRASPALKSLSTYGTPSLVNLINHFKMMPVKNFRNTQSADVEIGRAHV